MSPGAGSVGIGGTSEPREHRDQWETALRAPFHLATYPLRLLGDGLEATMGFLGPRFLEPTAPRPPSRGPKITPTISLDGPLDLGIGPAITWPDFPTAGSHLRLEGTWSTIDHRQAYFDQEIGSGLPGFRLLAGYEQKHDHQYFGIGNDSRAGDLSYFTLESASGEGALLLGSSTRRRLRIGAGFSSMSPLRGARGSPVLADAYPPDRAPFEHESTREAWYGVGGDFSTLDRAETRGVQGHFDVRRSSGMRARDPDEDEWKLEGRVFVPVFDPRRVMVLRALYAGVDPRGSKTVLPFYRLMASTEDFRFTGYAPERFRDRQIVHARIEYRWRVLHAVDALVLYDVGEVAPQAQGFRLADAHPAWGGGLRLGRTRETAWRIEVANGSEGWNGSVSLESDF